jgi:hypothetical protein
LRTGRSKQDVYSTYQIEYSRNLLFTRGTTLDAVFQGLIDRTRRYRIRPYGFRILAGMLVLRERVLKPVLAGLGKARIGRPPSRSIRSTTITRYFNTSFAVLLKLLALQLDCKTF